VPFDGEEGSEVEAFAVVDELLARDVKSITFAGGDPLMYPYLRTLISRVKDTNPEVFVQLDTNALQFSASRLASLHGLVDLYGIPLDAVSGLHCGSPSPRSVPGIGQHASRRHDP